jgi:ribosomal protein S18 acetylase RimI-like enzyme
MPDAEPRRSYVVRLAHVGDASAIARVHVASWRESYANILPDEILAAHSAATRTQMWERLLSAPSSAVATRAYVAEIAHSIAGFGSCGRQRGADLVARGYDGEISAVYVLRAAQGIGVGSALMRAMAADLTERGLHGVAVWVLRENVQARRFYERLGGAVVSEKEDVREQATLVEVAYGWPNLASLTERSRRPGQ